MAELGLFMLLVNNGHVTIKKFLNQCSNKNRKTKKTSIYIININAQKIPHIKFIYGTVEQILKIVQFFQIRKHF